MTDQPRDAAAEEKVAQTLATPALSSGSQSAGSGATSPDVDALRKEIEALRKEIPDIVESRVKSTKDKRFARVEELLKSADDLQAKARGVAKDALAEDTFRPSDPGRVADEETVTMRALSAEFLKDTGIAPNDPEYLAIVNEWGGKIKDPAHWDLVLRAHGDRRKGKVAKQDAPVSQAAVAAPASPAPDKPDVAALTKRLQELQDHEPLKHAAERKAIREQLAKLTGGG